VVLGRREWEVSWFPSQRTAKDTRGYDTGKSSCWWRSAATKSHKATPCFPASLLLLPCRETEYRDEHFFNFWRSSLIWGHKTHTFRSTFRYVISETIQTRTAVAIGITARQELFLLGDPEWRLNNYTLFAICYCHFMILTHIAALNGIRGAIF